jgi:hypothetical protein
MTLWLEMGWFWHIADPSILQIGPHLVPRFAATRRKRPPVPAHELSSRGVCAAAMRPRWEVATNVKRPSFNAVAGSEREPVSDDSRMSSVATAAVVPGWTSASLGGGEVCRAGHRYLWRVTRHVARLRSFYRRAALPEYERVSVWARHDLWLADTKFAVPSRVG